MCLEVFSVSAGKPTVSPLKPQQIKSATLVIGAPLYSPEELAHHFCASYHGVYAQMRTEDIHPTFFFVGLCGRNVLKSTAEMWLAEHHKKCPQPSSAVNLPSLLDLGNCSHFFMFHLVSPKYPLSFAT